MTRILMLWASLCCLGSASDSAASPKTSFSRMTSTSGRIEQKNRALQFNPGHLQSGPDSLGSSFASAGYVEPLSQTLHIVGTTYGNWMDDAGPGSVSSCFYAVVRLPEAGGSDQLDMSWVHTQVLGPASKEEACRDLLLDTVNQRLFFVGSSDPDGGVLKSLYNDQLGVDDSPAQIGNILDYSWSAHLGDGQSPLVLRGGRLLLGDHANYPVAVAGGTSGSSSNAIYVASMNSPQKTVKNAKWQDGIQNDPAEVLHYGSDYQISIGQFSKNVQPGGTTSVSIRTTIGPGLQVFLATDSQQEVFVAALLLLPDRLIVAGHTVGTGEGFNTEKSTIDGDNPDGFVSSIALSTMTLMTNQTFRIASGREDYVTGACFANSAPDFVYVTGYSKGHVNDRQATGAQADSESMRGYILKLQVSNMSPQWVQEFGATPAMSQTSFVTKAMSCAVTKDGANVYIAGNVEGAAVIEEPFGGTDVFVAQLSTSTGTLTFLKQIGSAGEDKVAFRGGIHVDENDNAILLANTKGQVYRERTGNEQYTDLFLATFKLNTGEHVLPLEHGGFVSLPPVPAPPATAPTPAPQPVSPDTTKKDEKGNDALDKFPIHSLAVLAVLVFIITACMLQMCTIWGCCGRGVGNHIKRDVSTDRARVLGYLHSFDVEDIELKHSATGGWHCSYMNDLAQGINKQTDHDMYSISGRSRFSRGSGTGDDSSAYDPLTPRNIPTSVHTRHLPQKGWGDDVETFVDETDDDSMSFGSSRGARRERRQILKDGLVRDSVASDGNSKRKGRSRESETNNISLFGNTASSGNTRRVNKAKERWQNREII